MSRPAAATLERERHKLWVTDSELIRLLGIPEKRARQLIEEWDSKRSGFPQKQKLYGGRRYMPHVLAYFDATLGPSKQGERR